MIMACLNAFHVIGGELRPLHISCSIYYAFRRTCLANELLCGVHNWNEGAEKRQKSNPLAESMFHCIRYCSGMGGFGGAPWCSVACGSVFRDHF